MKRALSLLALVACKRAEPTAAVDAAPVVTATPAPALEDARPIVKGACLSCHGEDMLAQQRLTEAQWSKTVAKMVTWGANLEPKDTAPLVAWLAATYGPDAGPYELQTLADADSELAVLPDGAYAGGDADRGRALYADRCSGCHGTDARGHIGVRLVDRPLLFRADAFADPVRRGRGKMAPVKMTDGELADVLAHLRSLHL